MLAQNYLVNKFTSFTLETLPKAIMLEGKYGCGKHTLVGMLATNLNLEIENISNKLSYEKIIDIYNSTIPTIYLIDDCLDFNKQNSILKFLEEPNNYSYVIILCEDKNSFLETIQNRCQCFKFEEYSKEDLKLFVGDLNSDILDICDTPGKCIEFSKHDIHEIKNLSNAIINKIGLASIPNVLSLSNKFNFGKDDSKLNVNLFIDFLLNELKTIIIRSKEQKFLNSYYSLLETSKNLKLNNLDKKKVFELGLLNLKKLLR